MFLDKIQQQQNFDEVEFISGYIMRLIKITEQNIKLGKETNANRQTHNQSDWYQIRSQER